ncbi:DUF7668 domain-containing protein [Dyadobacter crusticola]|uniref:DUF7668 domain-containing protein n=1 Tax=Dyadobacter crusticola TaxID=292407 RepID=UPI0004E13332|nr:hypothetical protein [Dyadobacter crusticola]
MEKDKAISAIKQLMTLIANRHFGLVYHLDYEKELTEKYIKEIVDSHPGTLSPTPDKEIENVYLFETLYPNQLRADIDLFYDGERGDLTVGCRVYDVGEDEYRFAIEEIHVM